MNCRSWILFVSFSLLIHVNHYCYRCYHPSSMDLFIYLSFYSFIIFFPYHNSLPISLSIYQSIEKVDYSYSLYTSFSSSVFLLFLFRRPILVLFFLTFPYHYYTCWRVDVLIHHYYHHHHYFIWRGALIGHRHKDQPDQTDYTPALDSLIKGQPARHTQTSVTHVESY